MKIKGTEIVIVKIVNEMILETIFTSTLKIRNFQLE